MNVRSSPILAVLLLAGALAGCDQRPGGVGATVPAPDDVIDAVPTEDDGERGSVPVPTPRPVPRPRDETPAEAEPEADDENEDEPEAPVRGPDPTATLNTAPAKATPLRPDFAISEPPVAFVPAPTAPRPTPPEPTPED